MVGSLLRQLMVEQGEQGEQMPNSYVLGNFIHGNNVDNKALRVKFEGLERLGNTDEICIEGFINTHLNALLNGSWHDIDKNLTYFDIDIEPNSQVHRNYRITINGVTYYLLIAQRSVLGSSREVTKYLCNYVNTRVKDYINAQSPVIVVLGGIKQYWHF